MANHDYSLANIGQSISLTTASLINSKDISNTILSNEGPYKRLMNKTIGDTKKSSPNLRENVLKARAVTSNESKYTDSFQSIVQPSNTYFKNKYIDKRSAFRLLSYINNDLLYDINTYDRTGTKLIGETVDSMKNGAMPSLYEGFTTLSLDKQIQNDNEYILQDQEVHYSIQSPNNNNPPADEINTSKINKIFSLAQIETLQNKQENDHISLEVNKKITTQEINEINEKIKHLKVRRELMFNKIASIEQAQLDIEKKIILIRDRGQFLRNNHYTDTGDYDGSTNALEGSTQEFSNISRAAESTQVYVSAAGAEHSYLSNNDIKSLNSKDSINTSPTKRLISFFRDNHKTERKTIPTLHHYYDPGSKICTIEKAHQSSINCLDFDIPFGVLCSADNISPEIKIWDLSNKKQISFLKGHNNLIQCMTIDIRYNILATGSKDTTLKLWDLNKSIEGFEDDLLSSETSYIHSFEEHLDEISVLSLDSNYITSGSEDMTVRQWDLYSGRCIQTLDLLIAGSSLTATDNIRDKFDDSTPFIGGLQSFDVALATGTRDGIVRLWDLRTGEMVRSLKGHTGAITCLKFDANNIFTGSADSTVRSWDLRTGESVDTFKLDYPVNSLDFDDKNLVVAAHKDSVQIYDRIIHKKWICANIEDITASVESVRYKNGYLVEGRNDGTINTWAI